MRADGETFLLDMLLDVIDLTVPVVEDTDGIVQLGDIAQQRSAIGADEQLFTGYALDVIIRVFHEIGSAIDGLAGLAIGERNRTNTNYFTDHYIYLQYF